MAQEIFIGIDGIARKNKKCYIGIDNIAREVKKAYIGVGGVARLVWSRDDDDEFDVEIPDIEEVTPT